MKIAAAKAIANHVLNDELTEDYIIPSPLCRTVAASVAAAVSKAAEDSGISRNNEYMTKGGKYG
jgi:malate dehydrogenase (oxaloacetate-decarboxylating)